MKPVTCTMIYKRRRVKGDLIGGVLKGIEEGI